MKSLRSTTLGARLGIQYINGEMWRIRLFNYFLIACVVSIPVAGLYVILGFPHRWIVAAMASGPVLFLTIRIIHAATFIDVKLGNTVGDLAALQVYRRSVPKYRYFDLYKAAARFAQASSMSSLSTKHNPSLAEILNGGFVTDGDRPVKKPTSVSQPVGPAASEFIPDDGFWVAGNGISPVAIVRVRIEPYMSGNAVLEVAAKNGQDPSGAIDAIMADSSKNSIYKGQLVELEFQDQSRDEFEGVVQGQVMDLRFLNVPDISEQDIILDEQTRTILRRSVLDFHINRSALKRLGLPGKRGLLFYGPPGTGKTYTTKFLAKHLPGVTSVIVSGSSLSHIRAVCNAARTLQPALVVMEDVDLVFSSREITTTGAPLGDLMDELDGFTGDDDILYILTTNAIERVEAAIKDRPGRISQCIRFGPPTRELRRLYLEQLLKPYTSLRADLDSLAKATDGCTQAFLKELCYRAIQICFGRLNDDTRGDATEQSIAVTDSDFSAAMKEMRSGAGSAGEAIIGFRVEDDQ